MVGYRERVWYMGAVYLGLYIKETGITGGEPDVSK